MSEAELRELMGLVNDADLELLHETPDPLKILKLLQKAIAILQPGA